MRRKRLLWAIAAALAVGNLVLAGSVLYPPEALVSDPGSAEFRDAEVFPDRDAASYEAELRYRIDGDVVRNLSVAVEDGETYVHFEMQKATGSGSRTAYQSRPGARVYHRRVFPRDHYTESEQRTVLRSTNRSGRSTVVSVEQPPATDPADRAENDVGGYVNLFANWVRYERAGADGGGTTTYEPRAGWYDGDRRYRIGDASGRVTIDGETDTLRSLDVELEGHARAPSALEYALADRSDLAMEYELNRSEPSVDRPEWVEAVRSGSG